MTANAQETHTVYLRTDLPLTITEAGTGRPVIILHGGGGPLTVRPIAAHLAATMRTITPTHPGWVGTTRPDWLSRVEGYAPLYLQYLEENDLTDVLVIGSSLGGWIGSEMALGDKDGRITGLILIDAGGVEVPGEPVRDFFALTPREIAEYSFHDGNRFYTDPATLPPEVVAVQRANIATMKIVAGDPYMHNPSLLGKLGQVKIPVLAIWGDSDRVMTPAYGKAFAKAFPQSRFELIKDAGHLPQIEQPAATFALIDGYVKDGR